MLSADRNSQMGTPAGGGRGRVYSQPHRVQGRVVSYIGWNQMWWCIPVCQHSEGQNEGFRLSSRPAWASQRALIYKQKG